jgi:hypothetical protein
MPVGGRSRSKIAVDLYFGRQHAVLTERARIKRLTVEQRRNGCLAEKTA